MCLLDVFLLLPEDNLYAQWNILWSEKSVSTLFDKVVTKSEHLYGKLHDTINRIVLYINIVIRGL